MVQSPKLLSVVIPVKEEAENIANLVAEIHAALKGLVTFEIICVDDGSEDNTLEVLADLKLKFSNLVIVRHLKSCGQSTAVRTGVQQAQYPLIATLDGDGQNDPADIPGMLKALDQVSYNQQRTLIAGFRKNRLDNWVRRSSSRVANKVREMLLKDIVPDSGCGLKLFGRETFLDLPYFDHMHRFLPALFMRAGGQVISVEVNHRPRKKGISKYGIGNRLWVGIVDLLGVMWLQSRAKLPEIVKGE